MNRESEIINLYRDNVVDVTFRLRLAGSREPLNLSGQVLKLSVRQIKPSAKNNISPIFSSPEHSGADEASGVVVFRVGRSVTGVPGTYVWAVTRVDAQEEVTLLVGQFNVIPRPGYPDEWIQVFPEVFGNLLVQPAV